MDETQRLAWAARAKTELELTEAGFDRLRGAMVDKLLATPLEAQALRERLYIGVQAMDQVREMLRQATYDAAMVNNEILLAQHGFTNPR